MVNPKVVIDTDPGVDDAIATLMALACPSIDLVAMTTVGGNVPLARGTRNALALLEYAGRTGVPVAAGAARPYRGRYRYSYEFHGRNGLGRRLPNPVTRPIESGAADFLAETLTAVTDGLTVIALGPLTNLAMLLERHPASLDGLKSLVVMGGAVDVPGNVTTHAEFNIWSDPYAADLVLSRLSQVTLVDLGACRQVAISREDAERVKTTHRLGRLASQILVNWFRRRPNRERFEFYDPLTFAAALDPEVMTTRHTGLRVEWENEELLGATIPASGNPPVAVSGQVDSGRFFKLLEELLEFRVGP